MWHRNVTKKFKIWKELLYVVQVRPLYIFHYMLHLYNSLVRIAKNKNKLINNIQHDDIFRMHCIIVNTPISSKLTAHAEGLGSIISGFVLLGYHSFHQPPGLCLSCLSSSLFLFIIPCLIHARISDWGRAFEHGHTFLHSWSGLMKLVVGLLHGAELRFCQILLLYSSCLLYDMLLYKRKYIHSRMCICNKTKGHNNRSVK